LALVSELDALVEDWLTLSQVAELLGVPIRTVRRLLQERQLVAVRRVPTGGSGVEPCVPGELLKDGAPLPEMAGTLTLLTDAGYSDEEALVWLFTIDPTLPGSPVEAMRAGRRAEIRRRAQALAF
jgi:excisionase family DNA binding protein